MPKRKKILQKKDESSISEKPETTNKPDNETTEKINSLRDEFHSEKNSVEEQQKSKRGRPSGSKTGTGKRYIPKAEREQAEQERQEKILSTFSVVSDYILELTANSLPNKIKPTESEKRMFSQAHALLLEKHFDRISKYSEEIAVLSLWSMFIIARIETGKKPNEKNNNAHGDDGERKNIQSETVNTE